MGKAELIEMLKENDLKRKVSRSQAREERAKTPLSDLNEDEKKKRRAEKFGMFDPDNEAEKKKARADRFGVFHAGLEEEKLKSRAARFDLDNPDLEEEKKRKRQERFNMPMTTTKGGSPTFRKDVPVEDLTEAERRALRAKKFGQTNEDDKKAERARRFGMI